MTTADAAGGDWDDEVSSARPQAAINDPRAADIGLMPTVEEICGLGHEIHPPSSLQTKR